MKPIVLDVIYCDDIRQEITGKYTLVGVYGAVLYVANCPALLGRLCVVARLLVPDAIEIQSLSFALLRDGQPLLEQSIPAENLAEQGTNAPIVQAMFGLSPFEITTECVLQVIAYVNGSTEAILGPQLQIQVSPSIAPSV